MCKQRVKMGELLPFGLWLQKKLLHTDEPWASELNRLADESHVETGRTVCAPKALLLHFHRSGHPDSGWAYPRIQSQHQYLGPQSVSEATVYWYSQYTSPFLQRKSQISVPWVIHHDCIHWLIPSWAPNLHEWNPKWGDGQGTTHIPRPQPCQRKKKPQKHPDVPPAAAKGQLLAAQAFWKFWSSKLRETAIRNHTGTYKWY